MFGQLKEIDFEWGSLELNLKTGMKEKIKELVDKEEQKQHYGITVFVWESEKIDKRVRKHMQDF